LYTRVFFDFLFLAIFHWFVLLNPVPNGNKMAYFD
jgi:hypothetical protein